MLDVLKQFAKFGVVGVLSFLLDYVILIALTQLFGLNAVLAGAISYLISTIFNYLASMRFVFTHKEGNSRGREFVLFCALSFVGLVLNEIIIWIGTGIFGDEVGVLTIIKVVSAVIVSLWNFFSRRHWLDGGKDTVSS